MIKAKLENGVEITLENGKWRCDDAELTEKLNVAQDYWKSKEDDFSFNTSSRDHIAAAKVLAQFGGEVSFITSSRSANAFDNDRIFI